MNSTKIYVRYLKDGFISTVGPEIAQVLKDRGTVEIVSRDDLAAHLEDLREEHEEVSERIVKRIGEMRGLPFWPENQAPTNLNLRAARERRDRLAKQIQFIESGIDTAESNAEKLKQTDPPEEQPRARPGGSKRKARV